MNPTINVLTVQKTDVSLIESKLRDAEHWWLYADKPTDRLSKIRARVNAVGYLVTGRDLQTKIVVIKDGLLTLSDHGCVDAVRFDDPRLCVFLSEVTTS